MKPILICFLPIIFAGMVCFSQAGNITTDSLTIKFPPRHFSNQLAPYSRSVSEPAFPLSLRNLPTLDGKSAFRPGVPYLNANSWRQRNPLWKDILGLAGGIAISAYTDSHNLIQYHPR